MRQVPSEGETLNARIAKCIDSALRATLGQTATEALVYNISCKMHLDTNKCLYKPLEFANELRLVLGDAGYEFMEKKFVTKIKAEFELESNGSIETLSEAFEQAKSKFLTLDR
jgi:hypothetical protein